MSGKRHRAIPARRKELTDPAQGPGRPMQAFSPIAAPIDRVNPKEASCPEN